MLLSFLMSESPIDGNQSPAPAAPPIRLDPCHSKVFSWLEWREEPASILDDRNRTVQPAGPALTVHYRYDGSERVFWPVSEEEARVVMNPGAKYGFSVGSAFHSIVKSAGKSARQVKIGERQETVRQREQSEKRAGGGKRWLA